MAPDLHHLCRRAPSETGRRDESKDDGQRSNVKVFYQAMDGDSQDQEGCGKIGAHNRGIADNDNMK